MIVNWNSTMNIRFKYNKYSKVKISLKFISIFGCDNKSSTISILFLADAKISAVSLNYWIQFQKWL